MSSSLLELPEDVLRHISTHLETPDLLHFLSSHRRLHEGLGRSPAFWKFLLEDNEGTTATADNSSPPRERYMLQTYRTHLPAVQWYPVQRHPTSAISPREGHISCVFATATEERICITGGYSDDATIYICQVPSTSSSSNSSQEPQPSSWTWSRLHPSGPRTFVYGSTLTTLDETRAVRFGGFQSGGYSAETNEVALLTVEEQAITSTTTSNRFSASWKVIQTQNPHFGVARAYHTTTFLGGRYLLVLGGMRGGGCIVGEAVLDTQTWTWLDPSRIISGASLSNADYRPSGRHGHSVVLDNRRNRIVLFGGGSGTDLLRSGQDNSEVWELKMGDGWETDLEASLPWTWTKIHGDTIVDEQEEEEGEEEDDQQEASSESSPPLLSPAETLCLGRCHHGVKVSPDTALMIFGSGRPCSTNSVIAFDLRKNEFVRPDVRGPLPKPRFTFSSALLQRQGYILVHGGYCSQEGDAIGDIHVLDLAPFVNNREFSGLSVDGNARCYGPVTNDEARRGRRGGDALLQHMFETLTRAADNQRQGMAAEMLGQMVATGQYGGRSFALMNMIANGSMVLRADSEDEEEDDDDDADPDYREDSDDAMGGL